MQLPVLVINKGSRDVTKPRINYPTKENYGDCKNGKNQGLTIVLGVQGTRVMFRFLMAGD